MAIPQPTSPEIERLEAQIAKLTVKRNKMRAELYTTWLASVDSLPEVAREVYLFISENPGCGRKELEIALPEMINDIPNALTILRRNRKMIENRGTRAQPVWYVV